MTRFFRAAVTALCLWGLLMPAEAQSPGKVQVATVTASAQPGTIARGGQGTLRIVAAVAPQFHINSHTPSDPDLIATTFDRAKTAGVTFGPARFPAAHSLKVNGAQKPLAVYQGRTVIIVPFSVAKTAKTGPLTLGGVLHYQGCSETACYPPAAVPVQVAVSVR